MDPCKKLEMRTDENGNYEFENVPDGSYLSSQQIGMMVTFWLQQVMKEL